MELAMTNLMVWADRLSKRISPVNTIVEAVTNRLLSTPVAMANECRGVYVCGQWCYGACGDIFVSQYEGFYLSDNFEQCDMGVYWPCYTNQCGCAIG